MSEEEKIQKYKKNKHKTKPKKKIKKVKWTELEDKILLEKGKEYNCKNWRKIASFLPGHSSIQCSSRYKRIQPGLIKGTWKKEEDEKLLSLFNKYGKNWASISREMPWRTGKQIRDRYLNVLDSRLNKEKFTSEEDNKIIELYEKFGNSWSTIAKYLIGRTGDMVKNRFYSTLGKMIINKENQNFNSSQFLYKKHNKNDNTIEKSLNGNYNNIENLSSIYIGYQENDLNKINEYLFNEYLKIIASNSLSNIDKTNRLFLNYFPYFNVNENSYPTNFN